MAKSIAKKVCARRKGDKQRVLLVEPPGMKGYLPIAAAYLVAAAQGCPDVDAAYDFKLQFDVYNQPFEEVLEECLLYKPDIIAFSCQGWAILRADALAGKLVAALPDCIIMFGGNHVSNQSPGFFEGREHVDILVHGEGEFTFRDLLKSFLTLETTEHLSEIAGISFRAEDGRIVDTGSRPRIEDIDEIPSPYLTGVVSLDANRTTSALIETNRGCPYHCSFCYWGAAVQSKVRRFSMERLFAEFELLAKAGIDTWFICDANFGILKRDLELTDKIIELRQTYGFPRVVNTNWAKNSNERIVEICSRLNKAGIHSSYTLALQSTDPHTLDLANRKNMSVNKIEEIARLCRASGVVPKGELIWGLPGENYETFLKSYDDLAYYTDTLSVYPLYILPNTEYHRNIERYKIKTKRVEVDSVYEYCIEHADMGQADFERGLRFIVSNNILRIALGIFYVYPRVLRDLTGVGYAQTIERFPDWVMSGRNETVRSFIKFFRFPLSLHRQSLAETWKLLRADRTGLLNAIRQYLEEEFHADLPTEQRTVLLEALEFDFALFPRSSAAFSVEGEIEREERSFDYDFLPVYLGDSFSNSRSQRRYEFSYLEGFDSYPIENLYFGLPSFRASVKYA